MLAWKQPSTKEKKNIWQKTAVIYSIFWAPRPSLQQIFSVQGTLWSFPISELNFWWMCPAVTLIKINEKIHLWCPSCHPPSPHRSLHPNGWWDTTVCFFLCIIVCVLHYSLMHILSLPSVYCLVFPTWSKRTNSETNDSDLLRW